MEKNQAESVIENLINKGIFQPKKIDIEVNGKFNPKYANMFIPYEKKINELISLGEKKSIKVTGKIVIRNENEFMTSLLGKIKEMKDVRSGNDLKKLYAAREIINFKKKIIDFSHFCGKTTYFVFIEGWIRKDDIRKIKMDRNMILEYAEDENAPVDIDNPIPFKFFESITKMYPPFKYGSIDITPIIFFSFSLIFGIMFANFIDGLVLFLVSLFLYSRTRKNIFGITIILSISSMIFGILFGEGLGFSAIIDVYSNPMILLIISLSIGYFHILLGFVLKIINDFRLREGKKILIPTFGKIILMLSFAFWIWYKPLFIPIALIGFILILVGGMKELAELPHIFGHIFSYSRIFAISISHFSISSVFGILASGFISAGGFFNLVIGLLIIVIGHIMLLTIELLIAFIHTLRLHILEFGTKFMEVGTRWFKPETFIRKFTKIKNG